MTSSSCRNSPSERRRQTQNGASEDASKDDTLRALPEQAAGSERDTKRSKLEVEKLHSKESTVE